MEAVTFSPDGEWLASATNNKTVLLWQWPAEQCAADWSAKDCQPERLGIPLTGHQSAVNNVVFLSDTALVSSDANGQLIEWNLDKEYWYKRACNIVNRSFTIRIWTVYCRENQHHIIGYRQLVLRPLRQRINSGSAHLH